MIHFFSEFQEFHKFIRKNHPASPGTVAKIADWLKEPRIDLLREIYENMGYIFFWECYLSALMIEWDVSSINPLTTGGSPF